MNLPPGFVPPIGPGKSSLRPPLEVKEYLLQIIFASCDFSFQPAKYLLLFLRYPQRSIGLCL